MMLVYKKTCGGRGDSLAWAGMDLQRRWVEHTIRMLDTTRYDSSVGLPTPSGNHGQEKQYHSTDRAVLEK